MLRIYEIRNIQFKKTAQTDATTQTAFSFFSYCVVLFFAVANYFFKFFFFPHYELFFFLLLLLLFIFFILIIVCCIIIYVIIIIYWSLLRQSLLALQCGALLKALWKVAMDRRLTWTLSPASQILPAWISWDRYRFPSWAVAWMHRRLWPLILHSFRNERWGGPQCMGSRMARRNLVADR